VVNGFYIILMLSVLPALSEEVLFASDQCVREKAINTKRPPHGVGRAFG
jgi:hypothetical protein